MQLSLSKLFLTISCDFLNIRKIRQPLIVGREMDFDQRLGEKIRSYRKMQAITQAELSKYMGISGQQIQKYESGLNRITVYRLLQITAELQIPVSVLLDEFEYSALYHRPEYIHNMLVKELIQSFAKIQRQEAKRVVCDVAKELAR
jgi:transcriptional regulator with XRE-family HTH domain